MKNYLLTFTKFLIISTAFLLVTPVFPQEPKIFTRTDFDLQGPVKSCRVITDYGKEDFEFNNEGLLTKSVTRYNENNYDVSYYKYENNRLIERRDERYQDGKFDEMTSMAHFYSYDSVPEMNITEKIISYNKEFQEQYDYQYNQDGKLISMRRSHAEGVDETQIEYSIYKDETTISYILNGRLQRTERRSTKKLKDGQEAEVVLIKEFIDGVPEKATERILGTDGLLLSELYFVYQSKEKSFVPLSKKEYNYDDRDQLESITSTSGELKNTEEYIYQFDNNEGGNWVKKIITPENSYTTRVIEYYDPIRSPENQN